MFSVAAPWSGVASRMWHQGCVEAMQQCPQAAAMSDGFSSLISLSARYPTICRHERWAGAITVRAMESGSLLCGVCTSSIFILKTA